MVTLIITLFIVTIGLIQNFVLYENVVTHSACVLSPEVC